MKGKRGCRSIALPIHNLEAGRGLLVKATPRPLYSMEQDTVSILQVVGWASWPAWTQTKIFSNH